MDYSTLKPGHRLPSRRYRLDAETVARYIEAVGDQSPIYKSGVFAPPTAVAALSLRGVIDDLAIAGGTIHAGQELEFLAPARVGQELISRATLVQNVVRGGSRFLSVDMAVEDQEGKPVMTGKGTIIVPA